MKAVRTDNKSSMMSASRANHHFDASRWRYIRLRDDDIIVSSWAKSGTTWTQQIVLQMLFDGSPNIELNSLSPWVDLRIVPIEEIVETLESQTHRRLMKTHLSAEELSLHGNEKYLYVARHPFEVVWSWFRHHGAFSDEAIRIFNETPGLVGEKLRQVDTSFAEYVSKWHDLDGYPFQPYWSHVKSWWKAADARNVKLVHFADLRANLEQESKEIAEFLDIKPSPSTWGRILEHSSLAYMKKNADLFVPLKGVLFKDSSYSFFGSGASDQWRISLPESVQSKCLRAAKRSLPPDCLDWLWRAA